MTAENQEHDSATPGWWCLIVIIALCVVTEAVLQIAAGLEIAPRLRATAYENGGFWVGLLGRWQPNYTLQPVIMFLSYGFLHAGLLHLAVNMIMLWSLGIEVIARVGLRGFVVLYFGAMICGGIGYAVLANTPVPMVGASGALFGLAGGLLAWTYVDRYVLAQALWPVMRTAGLLVVLNVVMWWALDGQLAWQTHLGGFVGGWILALLIDPRPRSATGT